MARILLVDGDPSSRGALERALVAEGLEVVVAADPEAAWEAASAFRPEVTVLGRLLPRTAVEELIGLLREAEPGVIFVSPREPWTEMARALRVRLGAPAPRDLTPRPPPVGPGTARVLARPPVAAGPLEFGALADLLVRLWRSAADGIVAVDLPPGVAHLFLLRGAPVAVHAASAPDEAPPDALAALCAAAEGAFAFHPGSEFAPEVRAVRQPALAPLLSGLRRAADELSFAAALGTGPDRVAERSAAAGAVLRELALDADDRETIGGLDRGTPLHALARGPGRPASLLWFLLRTGAVVPGRAAEDAPTLSATEPPSPG